MWTHNHETIFTNGVIFVTSVQFFDQRKALINMSQLDEIQVIPRVGEIVALPGIGTDGAPAPSYEVISVRYEYTPPSAVDPLSLSSVSVSVKGSNSH
jgi:hypothetical protein